MRLLAALCLPLALFGEERWIAFRFGPFEVMTNADQRAARGTLAHFEQLRHTLGLMLGKPDLNSLWGVRIVLNRLSKQPSAALSMGRDAFTASGGPLAREWSREAVRILLEANAGRMPAPIERGLADLFATIEVHGARVALGAALPAGEQNRDWARMQMLATNPEYAGKLRVLLGNLQQGIDAEPAYRNAFGKSPQEIEREVDAWGGFQATAVSGRALAPERDFAPTPVEAALASVLTADVLLAEGKLAQARSAYDAVLRSNPSSIEAREGLGFVWLREGDTAEARRQFAAAVKAGSRNARAHLEAGSLETAAKLNPRWAEPSFRLAQQQKDAGRRTELLRRAAALAPRVARYWQALALWQMEQKDYAEAARSWTAAERAAADEDERARVRQARVDFERRRADLEAAERKRVADEKQRELERLKEEALARIRDAEARAARTSPPLDDGRKVEPWWEGPKAGGKLRGALEKVDCLPGGVARLIIRAAGGKVTQLAIRDPKQVVIQGGGEAALSCGAQRPVRTVSVEFVPAPDPKLGTAGDARLVEFQ